MRLRVLVSAAGTPRPITCDPIDVLENGVTGARWTVADAWPDMNEARSALLRVLQARAGTPAAPLRQVLVRLPRRLCGPRLHPSRSHEGGDGFDEAIRWLRGLQPSGEPASPRFEGLFGRPWLWEQSYRGAGLGSPSPQRDPRRTRSRRGRSRKQRRLEVELGLRPSPGESMSAATGIPVDTLFPLNSEAVAREVGKAVAAASAKASDIRVDGDSVTFTATTERPLDENPELPKRSDIGPNDPNPWGVDPPAPTRPALTLRDLRRARADLRRARAPTNPDGTYNAFLGSAAVIELRSDPEFQRLAAGLLYDNVSEDGAFLSISGLRLIERREPGWSVESPAPVDVYRNHAVLDFRRRTFTFRGVEHEVEGEIRSNNQLEHDMRTAGLPITSSLRTWEVDLESAAALGIEMSAVRDRRFTIDIFLSGLMPSRSGGVRCNAHVRDVRIDQRFPGDRGRSAVSLVLFAPLID